MKQWEYDTEILHAETTSKVGKAYLEQRWPERKFPKFAVESLIPELNRRGHDGWKLVSLEPVMAGDKGDIKLPVGDPGAGGWTNTYLAVWRRSLES
jgi:hypothetical protein